MWPDIDQNSIDTTTFRTNGPGKKSLGITKKNSSQYNEFKELIDEQRGSLNSSEENFLDVKISQHAVKRIHERDIDMDGEEFIKLRKAISKLKDKGSKDSLIITNKGAYIVDVEKNVVVTAMDKQSVTDNIFTKIDSTLIVD